MSDQDAYTALVENYGSSNGPGAEALDDLAGFHNGATSFLALVDQHTDDDGRLPGDLDADTKRQLRTAQTLLERAVGGLESTAADRMDRFEVDR